MPNNISDEQFKDEMLQFKSDLMQFVDVATKRFDGLAADVRTNSFKLDRLETESQNLRQKLETHDEYFGALSNKIGSIDKRFNSLDERLDIHGEQLKVINGQITDVALKVIEVDKRLGVVEAKLSLMETKLNTLEEEARQVRLELNELNESIGTSSATRDQIGQLEVRVFQLEEKLAPGH